MACNLRDFSGFPYQPCAVTWECFSKVDLKDLYAHYTIYIQLQALEETSQCQPSRVLPIEDLKAILIRTGNKRLLSIQYRKMVMKLLMMMHQVKNKLMLLCWNSCCLRVRV